MDFKIEKDFARSLKMIDTYIDIFVSKGQTEIIEEVERYFSLMSAAAEYNKKGNLDMYKQYRESAKEVLKELKT